jgi:hypothetical protein
LGQQFVIADLALAWNSQIGGDSAGINELGQHDFQGREFSGVGTGRPRSRFV